MRPTRLEIGVTLAAMAVFLGPLCLRPVPPPGQPEQGMAVARRLLDDLLARHDFRWRQETFLYGHTPDEPAQYSYAVFSRDLKDGFYDVDVQIRWKAVPDTKISKGSRPMEVHLGQRVKGPI